MFVIPPREVNSNFRLDPSCTIKYNTRVEDIYELVNHGSYKNQYLGKRHANIYNGPTRSTTIIFTQKLTPIAS